MLKRHLKLPQASEERQRNLRERGQDVSSKEAAALGLRSSGKEIEWWSPRNGGLINLPLKGNQMGFHKGKPMVNKGKPNC